MPRRRAFEEGVRLFGGAVSAPDEDASCRLADVERLGQGARLVVRARTDRPSALFKHRGLPYGRRRTDLAPRAQGYPRPVAVAPNYSSGEDYVIEFLRYRFAFNSYDFEERVTAAAVKLGLVEDNDLDEDETADLVELTADGRIDEPRSGLGRYVVRHWEQVSLLNGESLVYWLRKLVFRGAWLDQHVKEGLLEVDWDEMAADFGYRDPRGDRPLLELAPVPSWHELQFRR
jgi:hypothetical protein